MRIKTANAGALKAIHEFLRFQIATTSFSCRTRKFIDLINLSGRVASIDRSSVSLLSLLPE
jgi:hypothetical protein